MRIKSVTDIITNSSTEVFILKDSRKNINEILGKLGFKGEVVKLTKDIYSRQGGNICELENVFVDSERHNFSWIKLYVEYILNPRCEKYVRIEGLDEKIYLSTNRKELQEKFKTQIIDPYLNENPEIKRYQAYKKFGLIEDFPEYDLLCNLELKPKIINWIKKNISEFPEYQKLLEMYGMLDISEVLGYWVDFFDDDEISPEYYLGRVYKNKDFDYKLVRLS